VSNSDNDDKVESNRELYKVKEIVDSEEWNNLVRTSDAGTIFHTTLWQDYSPHAFVRFGVYHRDRLLAGAVVELDDLGRGQVKSVGPYTGPVIAPGLSSEEQRRAVSLLATTLKGIPGVKFYASPWFQTLQPFVLERFNVQLFYTTVLRMESADVAWSRFMPSLRRNIRRAESDGYSVERTTDPATLLTLVCKTFSRQGRTVWFDIKEAQDCMEMLGRRGLACCFVTYDSAAEPVAACGIVWDWRRSYYILGGYDEGRSHRGGSSLALWQAIRYTCIELGLQEFDLEGSHIPTIERFFRQFGGEVISFYSVTGPPVQ
jgi:Acetyltransferase (GNAT) domain